MLTAYTRFRWNPSSSRDASVEPTQVSDKSIAGACGAMRFILGTRDGRCTAHVRGMR